MLSGSLICALTIGQQTEPCLFSGRGLKVGLQFKDMILSDSNFSTGNISLVCLL
jgi:hypothetical protein